MIAMERMRLLGYAVHGSHSQWRCHKCGQITRALEPWPLTFSFKGYLLACGDCADFIQGAMGALE